MEDKISNYVTGFRKSHGTQYSLVMLLERCKQAIDKGEYISVMYMDLSKAFDTINHDLLLAKLRAYGFSTSALNLLYSYLKYRKQKIVINNKRSSSEVLIADVPQGSIDVLLTDWPLRGMQNVDRIKSDRTSNETGREN